jgi:crossover junction endodeoxyribonuclease RuvC
MSLETLIAIDPALRSTGYAILTRSGRSTKAEAFGVIRNPAKLPLSGCLLAIREQLSDLIRCHNPTEMAVEGVIYVQSYRTAITLGAARGAAILAVSERGIPVYEYAPRRIKQAVVGRGAADKQQVAFMVRALLGLTETPSPDAADALAIGLTHFQARDAAMIQKTLLLPI